MISFVSSITFVFLQIFQPKFENMTFEFGNLKCFRQYYCLCKPFSTSWLINRNPDGTSTSCLCFIASAFFSLLCSWMFNSLACSRLLVSISKRCSNDSMVSLNENKTHTFLQHITQPILSVSWLDRTRLTGFV